MILSTKFSVATAAILAMVEQPPFAAANLAKDRGGGLREGGGDSRRLVREQVDTQGQGDIHDGDGGGNAKAAFLKDPATEVGLVKQAMVHAMNWVSSGEGNNDGFGPASDSFSMAYEDCDSRQYQGDTSVFSSFAPIALSNFPVKSQRGRQYIWNENYAGPDEPWRFMRNFDWDYSYWRQSNWYWMETMSDSDGVNYIKQLLQQRNKSKVLFWIHGWNQNIEGNFCTIYKMSKNLPDHLIIPIMWNTDRGETYDYDYRYDRVVTAPQAGITLARKYEVLSLIDVPKEWVCHSMGCFVTQFFAGEVHESSTGFSGNKFSNLFMVAPDVRFDLFDEYAPGSGDGKNSCYDGQWNDPDDKERIPDCRPGCGDALVNMVNGLVDVYWYIDDYALAWKETRLWNDWGHTWPISIKALGRYGNGSGGRSGGLAADCTKVNFVDAGGFVPDEKPEEHSYQVFPRMLDDYANPPAAQCG